MDKTELDAYESIAQNLVVLNKEARETKPGEMVMIKAILQNILSLSGCVCNPDELLVSSIHACTTPSVN